jgi:hypothetical protein
MRAVQAARNQVSRQQLSEVNPKFQAGPNELEKEDELKILQPTNAEQLKQLTALVETLRRQNLGDQAWQNALRLWQSQIATGALSDQVKFQFVRRFYFWLLGRGTTDDVKRTSWGRANVAVLNREVSLYIEQFSQRRLDYALQLSLLAMRVPSSLNGYYLYFKYIVNGKLKRAHDNNGGSWWELSDDDYLQDFEMFQQEFDGADEKANYKPLIRATANRPAGSAPFDASRPYPTNKRENEQHQLEVKSDAEIVAGVMKQENTTPNDKKPLPEAMATDEDGMTENPVRVPPPEAEPVPVNLQAVGIAPSPQLDALIGEVQALRRETGKQQHTTMASAESERTQHAETLQRLLKEVKTSKAELSEAQQSRLNTQLMEATRPLHERMTRMQESTQAELQQQRQIATDMFQVMQSHIKKFPALESNLIAAQHANDLRVRSEVASEFKRALESLKLPSSEEISRAILPALTANSSERRDLPELTTKWLRENLQAAVASALAGGHPQLAQQAADLAPEAMHALKMANQTLRNDVDAMSKTHKDQLEFAQKQIAAKTAEVMESAHRERVAREAAQGAQMRAQMLEQALQQQRQQLLLEGRQVIDTQKQALQAEAMQIVNEKESQRQEAQQTTERVMAVAKQRIQETTSAAESSAREAEHWRNEAAKLRADFEKFLRKEDLQLPAPEVHPKEKEELEEPEKANERKREREETETESNKGARTEENESAKQQALLASYDKLEKKMRERLRSLYHLQTLPSNPAWKLAEVQVEHDKLKALLQNVVVKGLPKSEVAKKYGKGKEWRNKVL